ncbi:MAG: nucleotidyltransferase family protein [Candidatus Competibacteraceae bacterium]
MAVVSKVSAMASIALTMLVIGIIIYLSMINPTLNLSHEKITAFCRRHHIKTLSLFGSVTRDDFRPDSDVDILVEFEEGAEVSLSDMLTIKAELSQIFGNRPVDLVTPTILRNSYRRKSILKDLEQIYAA